MVFHRRMVVLLRAVLRVVHLVMGVGSVRVAMCEVNVLVGSLGEVGRKGNLWTC